MKFSILVVALISAMVSIPMAHGAGHSVTFSSYVWATGSWSQCTATCGAAAVRKREVRCIRRGSYNVALPVSFCPFQTMPKSEQQCIVSPCAAAPAPGGVVANPPIGCQNGIQAENSRIYAANITLNSAGSSSSGRNTKMMYPTDYKLTVMEAVRAGPVVLSWIFFAKSTVQCSTVPAAHQLKSSAVYSVPATASETTSLTVSDGVTTVTVASAAYTSVAAQVAAIVAGANYGNLLFSVSEAYGKFQLTYLSDAAVASVPTFSVTSGARVVTQEVAGGQCHKVLYSGEKVGQAMSENSYVIAAFHDMANPCDIVSKGRGEFAITMNVMTTSMIPETLETFLPTNNVNILSVDPNYYSRQKLLWYWPTDDFPAETPDMKLVMNVPYSYVTTAPSKLPAGTPASTDEKYVYAANPLQAAGQLPYDMYMPIRYLANLATR